MKILKQKINAAMLLILLSVTACTQPGDEITEEFGTIDINLQIEETDSEDKTDGAKQEVNVNDAWGGSYIHYGKSPDGSRIRMDLFIYPDGENCIGYFSMEGSGNGGGTDVFSGLQGRMLLEIQGNQDMIDLYFVDNITDNIGRHETFDSYQNGDLMFSLKKKDGEVTTIWKELVMPEQEEDLKRGFVQRDEIRTIMLIDEKDQGQFLKAAGISEHEKSFYQYYNETGRLQLDFYYDMDQCAGVGIFYEQIHGQVTMYGFEIGSWSMGEWDESIPSVKTGKEDDLQLEEYEEEYTYNEQGQNTYFGSYGVVTGYKEPVREWVVKIVSTYRKDGTIQKQKRSYNARQLGRRSGTYYYDQQERLEYVDAYITHGYLESYFIYEGEDRRPQYCLVLDHGGGDIWAADFMRYEQ
ncbi:MAG: DUF5991 domain-containing protein [Lachnospiraceae bacterium]